MFLLVIYYVAQCSTAHRAIYSVAIYSVAIYQLDLHIAIGTTDYSGTAA